MDVVAVAEHSANAEAVMMMVWDIGMFEREYNNEELEEQERMVL